MLKGDFIGVKEDANVFVLEKRFAVKETGRAILRATALGLYFAELNGARVGDAFLTPGWTSYNKMLQVQEYDVTPLVKAGENVLSFTVGEGWYKGRLTWASKTCLYGEKSAVCAELTVNGAAVAETGADWTARESAIRFSGIYDGETVDLTCDRKTLTPCVVAFDKSALAEQIGGYVRNTERLAVKEVIHTPKGELVYDFGQNIAGVAEIRTPENFDGTIVMRFAEILVDGNFYTDNLRSAKATDSFTAKGAHTFSPEFTFHGFRYMKMEGAELPAESVSALVRHTDMERTGLIETGDALFDRFFQNVVWGQRGNFVDIPTDCPQRDERLGWTGDINAFCRTAAYNYDIRAFMKKWLADVRNEQTETGEIPHVVPDALGWHGADALWSDAAVMIPWTLYQMYGDVSFLSENFAMIKKYLAAKEANTENGLVVRGHEYADWLALDGEKFKDNIRGRTDRKFLTSVFYAADLKIAADIAAVLGDSSEKAYRRRREEVISAIRAEYVTPNGRVASDTMTAQALALHFDIVPQECKPALVQVLAENAAAHEYRVTTGFSGTPFLLFALADNGCFDTACKILMNEEYPGWLYEVKMGATTVWERWDSLTPDGKPNPDGMNSYNHYAYGSVMEFVYRRVAGIEAAAPGFEKIKVAPRPCEGLARLRAEYDSVRGKICSSYECKDGKIVYRIRTPEGVPAQICLPGEAPIETDGGEFTYERAADGLPVG